MNILDMAESLLHQHGAGGPTTRRPRSVFSISLSKYVL